MKFFSDVESITLEMVEPDPTTQPFPCPNQTVIYECAVDGYLGIAWIPPSLNSSLHFSALDTIGVTRNSSNGQFNAVLSNSEKVTGGAFLITSTLLINPPLNDLNGLTLTCIGVSLFNNFIETSNITLSGE